MDRFSALMAVERYQTDEGVRWRVRWRDSRGVKRSKSLPTKKDALALDAEVKSRKFRGAALPQPGRETLATAFEEWWRLCASLLKPSTQDVYRYAWNAHIAGRFDGHRLAELAAEPKLIEELTADMRARGVGPAAQRKALVVLSSVLTACVEWNKIAVNPVTQVPRPPGTRQRLPRPFAPLVIERIRWEMVKRQTKDASRTRVKADACLVSLMSYAGLRPGEALALTFGDIGAKTIGIDKAVADGEEGTTKTGGVRSVPLVAPLADDIAELRKAMATGSLGDDDDALIFPSRSGGYWSRSDFNNWRKRVWKTAVGTVAGSDPALARLATARPYDCRGSFVSLQLRAGRSPLEVASWAGHSPQVMFRHYASVIEELVGEPTVSAEEQIVRARELMHTKQAEELAELLVETLKPWKDTAEGFRDLLYGIRGAARAADSTTAPGETDRVLVPPRAAELAAARP